MSQQTYPKNTWYVAAMSEEVAGSNSWSKLMPETSLFYRFP